MEEWDADNDSCTGTEQEVRYMIQTTEMLWMNSRYSHPSHGKNTSQGNLRTPIHLQTPDQEDRHNGQRKIANSCSDAVEIGHIDDGVDG